jgi:DEAD/DEAH box helicase domain-containing protein
VSLNDLAKATLGTQKSGHGFLAIEYFRKGEMEKLKSYCLDDVKITKELYEYGKREGKIYFTDNRIGKREIKVNFDFTPKTQSAVSLSLPF